MAEVFYKAHRVQLSFLPEKQTDFIFTLLAEEFGFIGCCLVFLLYSTIVGYGYLSAMSARNQYSRLLIIGVTSLFTIHIAVNTAMVAGIIPVVGTPLPFLSFGGSNLMTMMISFGILLCASVNRNAKINTK